MGDPRIRLVVSALVVGLAISACDAVNRDTDGERQIAVEQKSIVSYSKGVPAADLQQTQFVRAWEEANEIKSLKQFRQAMIDRVIPRLDDYVTALKEMPTGSEDLKKIHGAVTKSHSALEHVVMT